jgi:hypothetical protein
MFENAFAALKGLFSRSFIVSAFLPVFFAVVINALFLALATKGLPGTVTYLGDKLKIADVATAVGIITLIAIPLAFALSPLLVSFRLLLEGEGWPQAVRLVFIAASRKRGNGLGASAGAADDYAQAYKKILQAAETDLPRAATLGNGTGAVASPKLIEKAEQAIAKFHRAFASLSLVMAKNYQGKAKTALNAFSDARTELAEALTANASNLPDDAPPVDIAWATRLSQAFDKFFVLMEEGREGARLEASRRISKRDALLVAKDPRPTRLGNLRAQIEDYCQTVYGVDLDYLWPRLRFAIDHDEEKFEPVEQAETQLNFALMLLLLVMVSSVGWLFYLLRTSDDPVLLATIGLLVPVLNVAFYLVVVASQRLLIATMKAATDRFRLGLLTALRIPAPKSYADERAAWEKLQEMSQGLLIGQNLDYAAPTP